MIAIGSLLGVGVMGAAGWALGPSVLGLFKTTPTTVADTADGWPAAQQPAATATAPDGTRPEAVVASAPPSTAERASTGAVSPEPTLPAMEASEAILPAIEPAFVERPFGKARGFRDALRSAGVSAAEADAVVAALTGHVDYRRCRPEHLLRLSRNGQGELQRLEYQVGRTEVYRATRTAAGFAGERVEVKVEVRRIARGGSITGSLGQALVHNGLGRSLVGAFVEVFERSISFTRDTRAGDTFRIIVDQQYLDGESLGYGVVHAVEYVGAQVGQKRGFWFEVAEGKGDFFDAQGRAANGGWLRTPLRYDHISSPFDMRRRHPVLKRIVPHQGVDYAASSGTPVWAAAEGKVSFAGYKGANGNLIALRHNNGYETFYAHLSRISRGIKKGTVVKQRQVIGAVGTTGRSTGPHLHFGLKRRGRFVDPMSQLNGPGKPLAQRHLGRFKKHRLRLERELKAIALAAAPDVSAADPVPAVTEHFHEEGSL